MPNDMRDRLSELIVNADVSDSYECKLCTKEDSSCAWCGAEKLADYLIANGAILPPCKVGDTIYRIDELIHRVLDWWEITQIQIYEDEIVYIDDSDNEFISDDIGKTVFFAKTDAEKALKEREQA